MRMNLKVVSPERELFNGEVSLVTLPGTVGRFTVLEHHAPLISTLDPGDVVYTEAGGKESSMAIGGGYVKVEDNQVVVCVG